MSRRRLTQRQRARIQAIQEQRREQAARRAQQSIETAGERPARNGRVIVRHGASLAVEDDQGGIYRCLTRQNIGHPVCGDRVVWQPVDAHSGVVTALLPRQSLLSRPDFNGHEKPLAANISQLVVVLAPSPEPSGYLLDQYLVSAETIQVRPLIAINKIDLLDRGEQAGFLRRFAGYPKIGYPLVAVSAREGQGMQGLIDHLKGQTSILVGQSGVGKSSLINTLLPRLGLQTGRLSEATGLGRHTTSAATCYHLPQGGDLIDSPGVRSFRLSHLSFQQLERGFREFRPYLGGCRFSDCTHTHEPACAIREAVEQGGILAERLEHFQHLAQGLAGHG